MKKLSGTPSQGKKTLFLGKVFPACMKCLDELRKQQAIDEKVYDQKFMDDTARKLAWERLQKNMLMDGDTMIDRRTGELLGPEVDFTYWKDKF